MHEGFCLEGVWFVGGLVCRKFSLWCRSLCLIQRVFRVDACEVWLVGGLVRSTSVCGLQLPVYESSKPSSSE
jgi:hypothetical protein